MITGLVKDWNKYSLLRGNKVFEEAFSWIIEHGKSAELGFHELSHSGCPVRVMEYSLKTREEAKYEHHQHTIDLQVTLLGNEGIEWSPLVELEKEGEYLEEKDFQFLKTPERGTGFIGNREGQFCILLPDDGHQPQRITEGCDFVRKLVVKIPVNLV